MKRILTNNYHHYCPIPFDAKLPRLVKILHVIPSGLNIPSSLALSIYSLVNLVNPNFVETTTLYLPGNFILHLRKASLA